MKHERSSFDVLKRIEEQRLKRNWTEYTLAKNSGLTQSTISTWYRKDLQPSIASIEKICFAFGISLSEFFESDTIKSKRTCIISVQQQKILDLTDQLAPNQRDLLCSFLTSIIDSPS